MKNQRLRHAVILHLILTLSVMAIATAKSRFPLPPKSHKPLAWINTPKAPLEKPPGYLNHNLDRHTTSSPSGLLKPDLKYVRLTPVLTISAQGTH